MTSVLVYAVGFIAQAFFSARILVQWIMSERAHRVLSPSVFWVFSLVGSILLFSYGWLRHDFSIILGQFISYYIYIWNLGIKGVWQRLYRMLRLCIVALPVVAVLFMLNDVQTFCSQFLHNDSVPLWLLVYGSMGQVIFTLRFVYQWYYSYRKHVSVLPLGFWIISLVGSFVIVSYGVFRLDPVLVLGQSVGFISYSRNIVLSLKNRQR